MADSKGRSGPLPPPPKLLDRRNADRHPAKIAAYLEVADDEEQHLGLVRNVSATGALLLTRGVFEVTDDVRMKLYLPNGTARTASGQVVRSETVTDDRAELWPYQIAVEFDTAADFARKIANFTEQQVQLGVVRRKRS